MKKLVINGPENYPGALYIIRPDGKRIRLEFVIDREKIAEVHRIWICCRTTFKKR